MGIPVKNGHGGDLPALLGDLSVGLQYEYDQYSMGYCGAVLWCCAVVLMC